ncbi:probable tetraacyldisaccharide 4'-kinase, mitochondrial isoform X3 [Primulina eburnea]|uniref:probable tetraacyldisaccharide 4'-kinase, mitochondrial isoform X3 n=1 Tax=Primulina eburnea TaxID=1245227 RepID=UPI003C6C00B4
MENVRKAVRQIAYSHTLSSLPLLHLSLLPLLSFASSLYSIALSLRHHLYNLKILTKHRLPVPVISVGNLTWGGNGKTPMVEFLARLLIDSGVSPLILTRGYGGADEAKMLRRHLQGTCAKIGIGVNRAATALSFLEKYGYVNFHDIRCSKRIFSEEKEKNLSNSDQIGAAILDDGMQVQEKDIKALESSVQKVKESVPIFLTEMAPLHFFKPEDVSFKIPLEAVKNKILLCISGIGFADSFIQRIDKMGPRYLDRLDFSDHHLFRMKDIKIVRTRIQTLESKFAAKPIVVATEKDYDRSPRILQLLEPYEVLVVCCRLQILPHDERTENSFEKIMMELFRRDELGKW